MTQTSPDRRRPSNTRGEILEIATALFTERGYDATSLRDIAEALGITKSSLYYHFPRKEAIVEALLDRSHEEIDELIAWIGEQPPGPDLLARASLHWIDSAGPQRIHRMRFARANRPIMRKLAAQGTNRRTWFDEVIRRVLPENATQVDRLTAHMAFDSLSAALGAADSTDASSEDILAAARTMTTALTTIGVA